MFQISKHRNRDIDANTDVVQYTVKYCTLIQIQLLN